MKYSVNQILYFILSISLFLSCEKYDLCSETPEIDTSIAFRIVDENGIDLAYNKTFIYPIIELLNPNGDDIIRHYYENDETQEAFFYLESFENLSFFNNQDYVLKYAFSTRDTLTINAEWTQNACDVEYSKINSISKGSTDFEQIDNVFLIVKD